MSKWYERELMPIANGSSQLHARWAKRMMAKIDAGIEMERAYPYPVQTWKLGTELFFVGMGGEAVVDYPLRFMNQVVGNGQWILFQEIA